MTWYHDTSWQLTDPSLVKERWPGHRGSTARGWEGTHRDLDLERFEKQKPSLQGMLTTLPSVATVTWKMRGGSPFWPGVDCGGGLRGLRTEAPWPLLRCMTITTELSTNATRSMPWMMSWCHAWPLDSEAPKASNSLVEHMRTAETALVRNHLCFHCVHRAPCSFEGALLPSFSELRRRRGRLQWLTFTLALALAFIDVRQRMRLRLHWPSIFPKATAGNRWTPGFWVASCFFWQAWRPLPQPHRQPGLALVIVCIVCYSHLLLVSALDQTLTKHIESCRARSIRTICSGTLFFWCTKISEILVPRWGSPSSHSLPWRRIVDLSVRSTEKHETRCLWPLSLAVLPAMADEHGVPEDEKRRKRTRTLFLDAFSGFQLSSSVFVTLSELLWQVMFVANDWQTGQRPWPRFFHDVPD